MVTNDQINEIEDKLRQAQKLVEECGAAICDESGEGSQEVWNRMTSTANDIGDIICGLWRLLKEA